MLSDRALIRMAARRALKASRFKWNIRHTERAQLRIMIEENKKGGK